MLTSSCSARPFGNGIDTVLSEAKLGEATTEQLKRAANWNLDKEVVKKILATLEALKLNVSEASCRP